MPGLDRTGPEGQGSRTGRQMGKCASKSEEATDQNMDMEDVRGRGPGRGFGRGLGKGRGRGFGRGRGRGFEGRGR
jgi:hypothetical protein